MNDPASTGQQVVDFLFYARGSGSGTVQAFERTILFNQLPEPLEITGFTPPSASGLTANQIITIDFNKPAMLDPGFATITCAMEGIKPYTGNSSVDGLSVDLIPDADYLNDDVCIVTVDPTMVRDDLGNDLVDDPVQNTSLYATPQASAPSIASTIPADSTVDVPVNQSITVNFSEPILLQSSSFVGLNCDGTPIALSFSLDPFFDIGNVMTLFPDSPLPAGQTCQLQFDDTAIIDPYGVQLTPVSPMITFSTINEINVPIPVLVYPLIGLALLLVARKKEINQSK